MSLTKRMLEAGYSFSDKCVCADCFDDYAIKDFINANLSATECSFCGREDEDTNIAAEGNGVIGFILSGIRSEYSTVDDECVPWDSEDQRYIVPTQDIRDLICEHPEISSRQDVLDWIVHSIGYDYIWCERDPAILSPEQGLIAGWEDFCEEIKHKTRFLFFEPRRFRELEIGDEPYYVYPSQLLSALAATVNRIGLNRVLDAGTKIFRVRSHDLTKWYSTAAELGPPPERRAAAGRMSAAGIPAFYGAMEEITAFAETVRDKPAVSIGTFELMRNVSVLDLSELPDEPSIFDQQRIELRVSLRFLHHFSLKISEPIELDGREHIEYTPTQVVSEFIKHRFRDSDGRSVEGVLYPSARHKSGTNIILFINSGNVEGVEVSAYPRPERIVRLLSARTTVIGTAEEASAY